MSQKSSYSDNSAVSASERSPVSVLLAWLAVLLVVNDTKVVWLCSVAVAALAIVGHMLSRTTGRPWSLHRGQDPVGRHSSYARQTRPG